MSVHLEHANLTVPDISAAIDFRRTVDPTFVVMQDATSDVGYRWVHMGRPGTYFALEEPHDRAQPSAGQTRYQNYGINHLGLVVDDIEATRQRLVVAGFHESHIPEWNADRIRRYFYDTAGMEWELVQYLTDDPALQHRYD